MLVKKQDGERDFVVTVVENTVQGVRIDIDAIDTTLRVSGDRFLLRQALGNLIDNALAFSPQGGVVKLDASLDGERITLQVRDAGPGVPDYARDRVFERFYSLARLEGGSRSSGVGLSFVAEVAGLHGGSARLQDAEGSGTRAVIELPAA